MLNFSNIYHWRVIHTSSIISSFTLHLKLSFKIIHLACKLSANSFPLTSFYNFLFSSSTVALNISTSFHCQFRISDYMCFVFLNSSNFLYLCARALSLLYCRFLKLVRLLRCICLVKMDRPYCFVQAAFGLQPLRVMNSPVRERERSSLS